jgi:hypothetical protein
MEGSSILALRGQNSASNRGTGADHGEQTLSPVSNKKGRCFRMQSVKNMRQMYLLYVLERSAEENVRYR